MPKVRDTTLPQHDADQGHYGAIPVEMLPTAVQHGDMMVWDAYASQWKFARLTGAVGLDVTYDASSGILEVALASSRVYRTFTADSYLVNTLNRTFTGNAVLKGTIASTLNADAVLKGTVESTFTADAVLV